MNHSRTGEKKEEETCWVPAVLPGSATAYVLGSEVASASSKLLDSQTFSAASSFPAVGRGYAERPLEGSELHSRIIHFNTVLTSMPPWTTVDWSSWNFIDPNRARKELAPKIDWVRRHFRQEPPCLNFKIQSKQEPASCHTSHGVVGARDQTKDAVQIEFNHLARIFR